MNKNTAVLPISLGMVHSYLLKGPKCVLVDAGYPGCEKRILSILVKNRISTGEFIIGDLITGGFIRSKKPQYSSFGDLEQMRNSMRTVMQLSPRIIYSGHGGPFLPDIINKYIRY